MKVAMLPVPDAPKPMEVLLFVHEKLAPDGVLLKDTAGTDSPSQTNSFGTTDTIGFAFIVMVNVLAFPVHPLSVGITVIIPLILLVVELLAVKEGILPLPEAARPMLVFEFVQLNAAPPSGNIETEFCETIVPLQKPGLGGNVTDGFGCIVIV